MLLEKTLREMVFPPEATLAQKRWYSDWEVEEIHRLAKKEGAAEERKKWEQQTRGTTFA